MISHSRPTSPDEAARERKLMREAADEILASPQLTKELIEKLGLKMKKGKSSKAVSGNPGKETPATR